MRVVARIERGDRIAIHYRLRDEAGNDLDSSEGEAPILLVAGSDEVIPGVSEAVLGMQLGERRVVEVPPEKAFGRRLEVERVVPRRLLPPEAGEGDAVSVSLEDAGATLWVQRLDGDRALLSSDHPLAGRSLTVEIVIAAVWGG